MFRQERIKIRAALRESEAVCLHAHWTYEYALAAHADPRPSTVTVHDHNMNILKYYGIRYLPQFIVWLYNVMLAKNVTAVSPYITKYVNRFRRKSDCVTIPNPLPEKACSRFVSSRADMGDGTVIMIGNEGELKNIKRGIQAFALFRLEHPSDRMIVIGKGLSPEGNIARWAAANKFARGITFTGEISYNDCLRYIRENKILLFPSLEESFGAPVQESLFLGTVPVGTTQARGVRWLIESCGGVLANGRDVRSLADGLMQARSFCQNEGELISMRRRIYKMASCEAVLSQYAKVYKRER
jgi:glycosyltransferase involved in cell wall biosynthesis